MNAVTGRGARKDYTKVQCRPPSLPGRVAVHLLFLVLCLIPDVLRDRIARRAGPRLLARRGRRRRIADVNLKTCFPDLPAHRREALRDAFATRLLRTMLDLGDVWWGSPRNLLRRVTFEGERHLEQARASGKPVILLVPHTVGLDIGGLALASRWPMLGLTSEAKSGLSEWALKRLRGRYGDRILNRSTPMRQVLREIESGRILYYLPDEDHAHLKRSVFASFFNEPTATLLGAGRLPILTGAKVVPTVTLYDPAQRRYRIRFFPALENLCDRDPVHNCNVIRLVLEKLVRTQPEDYLWTMRMFNNRPCGNPNPDYPAASADRHLTTQDG